MSDNRQVIERFYEAFARRDAEGMNACYHPEVSFSDPVFSGLKGDEARAMWTMLCERGKDLVVTHRDVRAEGERGWAHWEATYTFSATGRKVLNVIDAEFRFADGLILEHHDSFDLYAWTRMALGLPGLLLGWSPIVQNKVRRTAAESLRRYMARS